MCYWHVRNWLPITEEIVSEYNTLSKEEKVSSFMSHILRLGNCNITLYGIAVSNMLSQQYYMPISCHSPSDSCLSSPRFSCAHTPHSQRCRKLHPIPPYFSHPYTLHFPSLKNVQQYKCSHPLPPYVSDVHTPKHVKNLFMLLVICSTVQSITTITSTISEPTLCSLMYTLPYGILTVHCLVSQVKQPTFFNATPQVISPPSVLCCHQVTNLC